ncbi:metal ABC transporter ATP-binding protein [Metabacillus sp. GX 13764]|uniref:metal ABC transporter ATP-binding protein n=1 Tax=Metabacillus kandeliae TaxID=2900151 RepID=UPI001E3DDE1E|nr:metal ABC transporter ATP-binding protein [Metabacillus kandeliae]MCD7033080.1 metal ABC transporter ATP-binding protein [Metabacillus kandeliae]
MTHAIEISHLTYQYDRQTVLEDINLNVEEGAFLAIVGPNGSGKTTLLKCLLGLLKLQKGEIKLFGTPVQRFRQFHEIGFVSQKANSFNSGFPATVEEVVMSGLTAKIGMFRRVKQEDRQKVKEAINQVGMSAFEKRNIGELSGGQQQRVFIARALVSEPKLLILDEPTVGVDAATVQGFYEMLKNLNRNLGITLLLVTHDVGTITDKVTSVACLNKSLHFHGNPEAYEEMNNQHLSEMYGHSVHAISHEHHHHSGGYRS